MFEANYKVLLGQGANECLQLMYESFEFAFISILKKSRLRQ